VSKTKELKKRDGVCEKNSFVSFGRRLPCDQAALLFSAEENLREENRRAGCLTKQCHLWERASITWIQLNSSMQHTPPSASTSAPASSTHSPLSFTAVTVSPALLLPLPVVITARGLSRAAYLRSVQLPSLTSMSLLFIPPSSRLVRDRKHTP